MAYGALSYSVHITGDGPHLYLYDSSASALIPVTVDAGVYYTAVPGSSGLDWEASGTLAHAVTSAISAYGGVLYAAASTTPADAPAWWRYTRYQVSLSSGDYMYLADSDDAVAIAHALGWYGSDGEPDTTTHISSGYLHVPLTVWRYESGVMYDQQYQGWPEWVEERYTGDTGGVAVLAGEPYRVQSLSLSRVLAEYVQETGTESGSLPISSLSWWTPGLPDAYDPRYHGPELYAVYQCGSTIHSMSAAGISQSIRAQDIRPSIAGWLGMYDVQLHLYDTAEA